MSKPTQSPDRRTATVRMAALAALAAGLLAGCGGGDSRQADESVDAPFSTAEWSTDFARSSVSLDEFQSGGPPKDGIPAIDEPRLIGIEEADDFLSPNEPVALVEVDGESRGYPLQILIWHEIVNDEIAGRPVTVSFCPLCNSTVAFDRRIEDAEGNRLTLDFGTTGKLRNSDLVMYDRQTESWWQQITGEAIVGELTGTELEILPSQILSWEEFKRRAPDGAVLSRETGFDRAYGQNPYPGYDEAGGSPFLFDGELDDRLPPKERVTAVRGGPDGDSAQVYPFSRLDEELVVDDQLDGTPITVFFDPGVGSALDANEIAESDRSGAGAVFERRLAGRTLRFEPAAEPARFRDTATGTTWDIGGRAIEGELAGEQLQPVPSDDQFWFALAAFFPEAEIRG